MSQTRFHGFNSNTGKLSLGPKISMVRININGKFPNDAPPSWEALQGSELPCAVCLADQTAAVVNTKCFVAQGWYISPPWSAVKKLLSADDRVRENELQIRLVSSLQRIRHGSFQSKRQSYILRYHLCWQKSNSFKSDRVKNFSAYDGVQFRKKRVRIWCRKQTD